MLSKTAIHAVRATIELAALAPGCYLGAAAIADRIGAPRNYLGKLLQALAHAIGHLLDAGEAERTRLGQRGRPRNGPWRSEPPFWAPGEASVGLPSRRSRPLPRISKIS